jgi:hypothetical protein
LLQVGICVLFVNGINWTHFCVKILQAIFYFFKC